MYPCLIGVQQARARLLRGLQSRMYLGIFCPQRIKLRSLPHNFAFQIARALAQPAMPTVGVCNHQQAAAPESCWPPHRTICAGRASTLPGPACDGVRVPPVMSSPFS